MKILKSKTKKPIDYRYLLVSEAGVNKCFIKTVFGNCEKISGETSAVKSLLVKNSL